MDSLQRVGLAATALFFVAASTFAQCPTATTVTPGSPVDTNVPLGRDIIYSWSPEKDSSATLYEAVIRDAKGTDTAQCNVDPRFGTQCTAQSPATAGIYRWFVRTTFDPRCTPLASPLAQFTVGCLDSAPQPLKPAPGAQINGPAVTLAWSNVGADFYDVYLDRAGSCGKTLQKTLDGLTTSVDLPVDAGADYEWKIVARTRDAACPARDTGCLRFSTAPPCPSATQAAPSKPVGENVAVNTPITFSWSPANVADVAGYDVVSAPTLTVLCSAVATATSCTSDQGVPLPGTYEWGVRTKFTTACNPVLSAKAQFTAGCPVAPPIAVGPISGDTNVPLNTSFKWMDVGAEKYDVYLDVAGAGCSGKPVATVSGTSFSPSGLLQPSTTYEWRVVAITGTCPPQAMACARFQTAACPSDPSVPVDPASGATITDRSVTFSWKGVATATGYDVMTSTDGATFVVTASTSGPTSTRTSAPLPPGDYAWLVRTRFGEGCPPVDSTPSRFTVVAPCNNSAPTLIAPAAGEIVPLPVKFGWNGVAGATSYNVYALSAASTVPTLIGSTTATSLASSSLPTGDLEWFVRAFFDGCPAVDSAHSRFSVKEDVSCPTGKAVLVLPKNGALAITSPVHFDWDGVLNAIGYRLIISLNGGSPTAIGATKDTELDADIPAGKIEWFVETQFDNCPSTESAHFTFNTVEVPTCPVDPGTAKPIAPADGAANVTSPVTFQWSAVTGATGYRVLASFNGSSSSPIASTAATQATVAVPQGTIVWLVEALFGDCPSTFSPRTTFTVSTPTQCNTTPTSLVSPANGASGVASPVVFEWKEVTGAVEYELFASTNGKEFQLLGSTERTALERIVLPGTIDWYVVTEFKGCPEQRSEVFRFKVEEITTCGDGTIDLKSPQDGATVTSPATFAWSGVAGASFYRVWVAIDEGAPAALARTTDTSVVLTLPSGKAEWYVEAVFVGCPSILSARARFAITAAANCDANQPVTIESPVPSSGGEPPEETSPVDLRWRPSERARGYRVWVAIAGQPFADVGFTTDTHLLRELKPGKYEWYVDAYFDSCPPVASKHAFFTIASTMPRCGNDSAVLVSPADGSNVGSPVTFLWSSVANGDDYRVFLSLDGADFILLGETDETSMTRPIPPGDIVWYVETTFEECTSTFSQKSRFGIARAANCNLTDAPRLVSPADGATNVPSLATFDWDAVSGATGYLLFAVVGDDGATALAETEDTSVQKYVPVGTIEWWVVAFRGGCPPVESKHFRFSSASPDQCTNRRPILVSPADNASGLLSPVHFSWTAVENATGYKLWAEVDKTGLSPIATTTATQADVELPSGRIRWFVEANFTSCPPTASAEAALDVIKTAPACGTPDAPVITVPGQVVADSAYTVRWYPVANANVFELQEAKKFDFSDAGTTTVDGLSFSFTHTAIDTPVQYLYRVRAVSACSEDRGAYSNVIGIFIIPPAAKNNASAEIGTPTNVIQTIFLPGSSTPVAFTARSDKSWVAITPSSGVLGPAGLTLVITADPSTLALGTNTGTVIIEYAESGKNGVAHASRTSSSSVSVSLVTPVSAKGKNTPLPDSLIIPAVAHTAGANGSMFESDIRLANTSAQTMKYQVFFTPSGVDGTQKGSATTIQVDAGATMALDDILATFFGAGSDGKGVTGMMEIRPITTSSTTASLTSSGRGRTTVASSRTYNVTENGTFGQFIPAIPYSQFIAKSASATRAVLSLQQISQSANYRMNFGLVEASGEPVSVLLSVFDDKNKKVAEIPKSLQASEHRQFNSLLAENGLTLENGRVEVEVTSPTGRVTAYASVVDNRTNDPLLVSPVLLNAEAGSTRFVLPSIGDFDIGFAHWKSDIRLFNAGSSPAALTLSYYPQGNPAQPSTITATLQPGEVRAFDNFIETNFNKKATAGSLVVTSAAPANIVATAKTYTASATGTFGQFIPGVTPDQSIAAGSPALQILQLEQSGRFRTNIGVAETSGKPAVAEIAVVVPGAKTVPRIQIPLAANEFRQISLLDFNLGTVYNGRATVKVMSGTGTVTAYGSVIDQLTQDPTYVPAQ